MANRRLLPKLGRICTFSFVIAIFGYSAITLPNGDEFEHVFPKKTSFMTTRELEAQRMGKGQALRYYPIALSRITPELTRAVLAGEDTKFFSHKGFDWEEVLKAVKTSVTSLSFPRGASTITQQLAKNLYLSEARTPTRKVKELLISRRLEQRLSKRRILELYLNVIEWGPGVFGVKAASSYYFEKDPSSLSASECAFLAAVIPSPRGLYNPKLYPKRVKSRQVLLARRMKQVHLPREYYGSKS